MQLYFAAFRDGLQTLGWTDGHNIRIEIAGAAVTWIVSEVLGSSC